MDTPRPKSIILQYYNLLLAESIIFVELSIIPVTPVPPICNIPQSIESTHPHFSRSIICGTLLMARWVYPIHDIPAIMDAVVIKQTCSPAKPRQGFTVEPQAAGLPVDNTIKQWKSHTNKIKKVLRYARNLLTANSRSWRCLSECCTPYRKQFMAVSRWLRYSDGITVTVHVQVL